MASFRECRQVNLPTLSTGNGGKSDHECHKDTAAINWTGVIAMGLVLIIAGLAIYGKLEVAILSVLITPISTILGGLVNATGSKNAATQNQGPSGTEKDPVNTKVSSDPKDPVLVKDVDAEPDK